MIQSISSYLEQNVQNHVMTAWYITNYQYRLLQHHEMQERGFLLGTPIRDSQQGSEVISECFWFTYQSGFAPYKDVSTDSGWGCMIRVAQMLVGQLIKRHMNVFFEYNLIHKPEVFNVLQYFADGGVFSIQKFLELGQQLLSKKVGEWYSPNQVVYILEHIIQTHRIQHLLGMEMLQIFDNFVNIQQIIQILCQNDRCACTGKIPNYKKILQDVEEHVLEDETVMIPLRKKSIDETQIEEMRMQQLRKLVQDELCPCCFQARGAIAIVILTRIGCDHPNKDYIQVIKHFMCREYTQGLVGGRPKLANYILGFVDDQFVYLDPHLVQSAKPFQRTEEYKSQFFTENIMFMQEEDIDCSLGLALYFHRLEDVILFMQDSLANKKSLFFTLGFRSAQLIPGHNESVEEFRSSLRQSDDSILICDNELEQSQFESHLTHLSDSQSEDFENLD